VAALSSPNLSKLLPMLTKYQEKEKQRKKQQKKGNELQSVDDTIISDDPHKSDDVLVFGKYERTGSSGRAERWRTREF